MKEWSILDFAKDDYILPETGKPIKLELHQKRILRDCFTMVNGRFPYQTIIYSCPKKSGKSEIAALVGLYYALSQEKYNEIYFVANDLEQSQSRGFKRATRVIETNPSLGEIMIPKRSLIDILQTGTEIQALSSDYAGVAGASPGLTVWDELWAYASENSRRLWDELAPTPTRINSLRFIVTYAGFEGESTTLFDLYNKGLAGECIDKEYNIWVNREAGIYMYWDHKLRMPWQLNEDGRKYYEREEKILRPNTFRRLHRNEWVSSISSFIPMDAWDDCVNPELHPIMVGMPNPLFIGVDIGIKRDTTGVTAVYWDKEANKIKLASHRIWQPIPGESLDLQATIEAYLLDLHKNFRIASVYYDPSQFIRSAQFLAGKGIPVHEYQQVPTNLTSMTQILYELVRGRNLEMYPSPELRRQNMDCVIVESSRGMRIAKDKASQKIDAIVALAMACQAAWDGAGITSLPESQPETASRWHFEPLSASIVDSGEEGIKASRWRI